MPSTAFTPSRHGFHFPNEFINSIVSLPVVGEITTSGLCGGMSFASLDYYYASMPIPTHVPNDFPGNDLVPADGSRLRQYIYSRQMDTFNPLVNPSIAKFVTQAAPFGRTAFQVSIDDEWPLITQELDAGRPVPIGLIADPVEVWSSHQVVAIGYEASPQKVLHLYDCNHPDRDVTLVVDEASTSVRESTGETWLGFFLEQYEAKTPTYVDLCLASGIHSNPASTATLGQNVEVGFRIGNTGEYTAHLTSLDVAMWGPAGEDLDGTFVQDGVAADFAPGSDRGYVGLAESFGSAAGVHELVAYFLSSQGEWYPVPAGAPGTSTTVILEAT